MSKKEDKVISYEVMGGWPIEKMSLRDIIKEFGATFNEETKKWEIAESPTLDVFPIKLNDDGMGYGINEEYVISVDLHKDENRNESCNIFTEKELPYIDIYKKAHTFPGDVFTFCDEDYAIDDVDETDDGFVFICSKYNNYKEKKTFGYDQVVKILEEERINK